MATKQAPKPNEVMTFVCPNPKCRSVRLKQLNDEWLMTCLDCGTTFNLYSHTLHIDVFLEALRDGEWHTLLELNAHPLLKDIPFTKLLTILGILVEHGFVEESQDVSGGVMGLGGIPIAKVRLAPSVKAFLERITQAECSEHA